MKRQRVKHIQKKRRTVSRRRKLFRKRVIVRPRLKGDLKPSEKEALSKKKPFKGLSELIALGKEKGHLTFEEVNNILPVEIVSSEEIDEILSVLGDENIKLVDTEEEASKEAVESAHAEKKEAPAAEEVSKLVQIDDPVKMYLRQMGQISLLTRKE